MSPAPSRSEMDVAVTLGQASWSMDAIEAYLDLGVRTFRFPFSKPGDHLKWCDAIRSAAARCNRHVFIFADLPGGKPRLSNPSLREVGADRQYSVQTHADCERTSCDWFVEPWFSWSEDAATTFVIGDGENRFLVEEAGRGWVAGRFQRPGLLDVKRSFMPMGMAVPCFTERDKAYARLAREGFDGVALSFASDADQVQRARQWLQSELNWRASIVAKIETSRGVSNIDSVAAAADRVLIGRGDLVIQVGYAGLWAAQKRVVEACSRLGRHVTIATGILQSMFHSPVPTRAECIDVSAAIDIGVNGFLFSGETALGKWPVDIVRTLMRLIDEYHATGRPADVAVPHESRR